MGRNISVAFPDAAGVIENLGGDGHTKINQSAEQISSNGEILVDMESLVQLWIVDELI